MPTHGFLEAVASAMLAQLKDCGPDTVTGVLMGYAKLSYCHDGLLDAIAKAVISAIGFPVPD